MTGARAGRNVPETTLQENCITDAPTSAPPVGRRLETGKGLVLMGLGMFLFSAVDTLAKFLTDGLHPIQITWARQIGLLAGAVMFFAFQGPAVFRTSHLGLQVLRGVFAACSAVCFIFALRHVALADAVAISFVAPFVVTLLGAFLLKERLA